MTTSNRMKWGTLLSCSLSCFVAWLDFAIVNTALPAIEQDLSATLVQLQWVMNAFMLALASLIITLGRISDHYGRRAINIGGVALFGLSSLLAGLSLTPGWLIFARVLQGVASGAIIPSSLALISHAFPGAEKGKAIGVWSGVTGFGMALGPVLGGALVSALNWRWIFYINVPFAIASIIMTLLFSQESKLGQGALKPDYKGCSLLVIGLTALIFGFMHAPDWGWLDIKTMGIFVLAICNFALFYVLEKRSSSPTIPFELFSSCEFFCSNLVMFCYIFVFSSVLFLVPLYLMQMREYPAYAAGLIILPITASIALFSPFVGQFMHKFKAKHLMVTGLFIFLGSPLMQIFFSTDTSILYMIVSFLLFGIGWSIGRPPATTTAIASAPHHWAGTATAVLWTVQNTGGALSVAIILTIFRRISGGTFGEGFLRGYQIGMWILCAVVVATLLTLLYQYRSKKQV